MPLNIHKIPQLPTKFFSFYGQKTKAPSNQVKKGKLKVVVGTNKLKMRLLWLHTRKQDKKTLRISSSLQNLYKGKTGIQIQKTPQIFIHNFFFFFGSDFHFFHAQFTNPPARFLVPLRWLRALEEEDEEEEVGFIAANEQWSLWRLSSSSIKICLHLHSTLQKALSPLHNIRIHIHTHNTYHLKDQNFIIK